MSSTTSCTHPTNTFCFICGEFIKARATKHDMTTNKELCLAYEAYFNMPVRDLDKEWVPKSCCTSCKASLSTWYRTGSRSMKFGIPRIWRGPSDHEADCFFCQVQVKPGKKSADDAVSTYPDLPSSSAPVPHSDVLPVPVRQFSELSTGDPSSSQTDFSSQDVYELNEIEDKPYFPNQRDINDLVRDLDLPKVKAEILISRLKQWNLLDETVRVTEQRKRHLQITDFFTEEADLCFCNNVNGLFEELKMEYKHNEWRLFIDGSSQSMKAVLLHNGNQYPSIPIAYSSSMKENYESIKLLLDKVRYEDHKWEVIGDFKMIAIFMGLQGGYTKHSCYLCLWDSRADHLHYNVKNWEPRSEFVVGAKNVKESLIDPTKILLPPLHLKLGLMKQFVKGLDPESKAFKFLREKFPRLSEAKVKAGVFVGPQIKEMMKSQEFTSQLSDTEKKAWGSFVAVAKGFLGNHNPENYETLVNDLVEHFGKMGCRMSLKLHILNSHLDSFKDNMGDYSEEQGERFHQDIMQMEGRYKGKGAKTMMGDYFGEPLGKVL